jgi:hypothetical protein
MWNIFYQFAQRSRTLKVPLVYPTCIVLVICAFLYCRIERCCYVVKPETIRHRRGVRPSVGERQPSDSVPTNDKCLQLRFQPPFQ